MTTERWMVAGGIFNLGFAVFHLFFWKLLRWRDELARVSFVNRQVVQVMNLCLIAALSMMAAVSLLHARDLPSTPLGRTLLAAFALFWLLRLVEEPLFFGWRTRVSWVLTALFAVGTALYAVPLFSS